MKIAISTTGSTLDAAIDPRFGRAAGFIVVDTQDDSLVVLENASQQSQQGAGIGTAQALARLGTNAVITGHCGPNAFQALAAAGIEVFTGATGTAAEALKRLRSGGWKAASGADVAGHWA
jgi:predicted Fe-Mo cluster-binding NifX family protein